MAYANVEDLYINIGDHDSVMNIRGTSATTEVTSQSGDDYVFISSDADVLDIPEAEALEVLLGWVDYMEEDLTVIAGSGRNRLMISDEKSTIAKGVGSNGPATMTSTSLTDLADELGNIYFSASGSDGLWAAGVSVWLGEGDDSLEVLSVPANSGTDLLGFSTTTRIYAGYGNDTMVVTLDADEHDGAIFFANGQAGDDVIDGSGSSLGLILMGDLGDDVLVSGSGNDIVFGDLGMVSWFDGAFEKSRIGEGGGFGDFTDGIYRLTSEITSLFEHEGGKDVISMGSGDDVGLGGLDDDAILAGEGNDIVFGDAGFVSYHDSGAGSSTSSPYLIETLSCSLGGNDVIDAQGGSTYVNYLIGGTADDHITGSDGWDIAFG